MKFNNFEKILVLLIGAFLIFAGVNFDEKLQGLFGFIIIFIVILKILDFNERTYFPIERTRDLKKTFFLTVIGLVATYLGTMFVFWFGNKFFGTQAITLQAIFTSFAQQTLIFSGSVWLSFIAIGIVVAISETWLLATLMDFIADITHADFDFRKFKTYALLTIIVGFIIMLHFNAKGITGAALVPVAVFFLVSAIIIKIEKQWFAAGNMHVINNSIALAISYNLINPTNLQGPIIVGSIVIGIIYMLFRIKILRQPIGG